MAMSASGIKDKLKTIAANKLIGERIEKGAFYLVNSTTGLLYDPIKVQFNPSEYTISRSNRVQERQGVGQEGKLNQLQAVSGGLARLSITFYFDNISGVYSDRVSTGQINPLQMAAVAANRVKGLIGKDPGKNCDTLVSKIKFNADKHAPEQVCFVWGTLKFKGVIVSCNVTHDMFNPDGTPVRAKVAVTMVGEETVFLTSGASKPFESPDRTKKRTLAYGDQLWNMANEEYDDPSKWKVIAAANGVLNPRTMQKAGDLKVPSIK